jgi:putative transposase
MIRNNSKEHSVAKMCGIFEVSPSGYYAWMQNPESMTERENQAIYEVLKASYEFNKGCMGLDKLLDDVRLKFPRCSRNCLYNIQRAHKLYSIRKRKFKATTNSKHDYPVAQNLLNQNFHVDEPNKVWVTDISYIGTDEGWLYLATVRDLFDRQIVGFATGNYINTELCKRALLSAVENGLNPYAYLTYIFKNAPNCDMQNDDLALKRLLPSAAPDFCKFKAVTD